MSLSTFRNALHEPGSADDRRPSHKSTPTLGVGAVKVRSAIGASTPGAAASAACASALAKCTNRESRRRPTPACQQHFRRINLHWHDLRHMDASRLAKAASRLRRCMTSWGMHPSLRPSVTTIRSSRIRRRWLEVGEANRPTHTIRRAKKPHDRDKVSSIFQGSGESLGIEAPESAIAKQDLKSKRKKD